MCENYLSSINERIHRKAMESKKIFCGMIRRQVERDVSCNKQKISSHLDSGSLEKQVDPLAKGMTCSSDCVRNDGSLLSLQSWMFRNEVHWDGVDDVNENVIFSGNCRTGVNRSPDASQAEHSPRSVSLGYRRGRVHNSLRNRWFPGYSVKPATSTGNCLIPHLYNEHFKLEECILSLASSSTVLKVRPLIITDGDRMDSKSTYDTLGMPCGSGLLKEVNGLTSGQMETVIGVPPLPQFRIPKQKSRDELHRNLETTKSPSMRKGSHSQGTLFSFSFLGTMILVYYI